MVNEKGDIAVDFDGFIDQTCLLEERKLKEKLLKYGVCLIERNKKQKLEDHKYRLNFQNERYLKGTKKVTI